MTFRVAHHRGIGQCSGLLSDPSVAAVVVSQWRDIARYVKIRQMSRGGPDRNRDSGAAGSLLAG
jgi:hypothetical protein